MIFGIAFRLGAVALAAAAAGVWWLYQRLTQKGGENASSQTRDEFVLNPRQSRTLQGSTTLTNKRRWILPEGQREALPEKSKEYQAKNFDPADPQVTPQKEEVRNVGPFYLEELYFEDGSLFVQVHDSPLFTEYSASIGAGFSPEEADAYLESAEELISDCEPTREGGEYCYQFLAGPRVTSYSLYDAQGEEESMGVIGGGLMTYDGYLSLRTSH